MTTSDRRALCFFSVFAVAASACAANSNDSTSQGGDGAGAGGPTTGTGGGEGGGILGTGGSTTTTGTTTGTNDGLAEVYGHGPYTLYRLDPTTKAVTTVGNFQGCDTVIDIALDKDSNLFGTTFGSLVRIDKTTAACTVIAFGAYPNSLSFVPEGTVDPLVEALVGYNGYTYVRIDPNSGVVTTIGALTGGYSSSGDIVSVKGGKTYLTVNSFDCFDCIVEVDPKTGDMVKNWGPVGYGEVFGLAFWAGAAYGFSNGGNLFEITFTAAGTVTTAPIAIPGNPVGLSFYGAGSTTHAPPEPIPE